MYKCLKCHKQGENRKDFKRIGRINPIMLCNECNKIIQERLKNK